MNEHRTGINKEPSIILYLQQKTEIPIEIRSVNSEHIENIGKTIFGSNDSNNNNNQSHLITINDTNNNFNFEKNGMMKTDIYMVLYGNQKRREMAKKMYQDSFINKDKFEMGTLNDIKTYPKWFHKVKMKLKHMYDIDLNKDTQKFADVLNKMKMKIDHKTY